MNTPQRTAETPPQRKQIQDPLETAFWQKATKKQTYQRDPCICKLFLQSEAVIDSGNVM